MKMRYVSYANTRNFGANIRNLFDLQYIRLAIFIYFSYFYYVSCRIREMVLLIYFSHLENFFRFFLYLCPQKEQKKRKNYNNNERIFS